MKAILSYFDFQIGADWMSLSANPINREFLDQSETEFQFENPPKATDIK